MTTPADPPDVLCVLRPVRDPLARSGYPPRDADYRLKPALKSLLRSSGLPSINCRDVKADTRSALREGAPAEGPRTRIVGHAERNRNAVREVRRRRRQCRTARGRQKRRPTRLLAATNGTPPPARGPRPAATARQTSSGRSGTGEGGDLIEAALLVKGGHSSLAEKRLGPRSIKMSRRLHAMPFVDLARESLRRDGRNIPSDRSAMPSTSLSTGSMSTAFGNVLNKIAQASYALAPATWR